MNLNKNKLIEFKQIIISSYTGGANLREIAKLYNCSVGTIRNLLIKEKVTMRPKGARLKNGKKKTLAEELNS